MRWVTLTLVCLAFSLHAADVPIHFRFEYQVFPPDVATGMLGSMNNWGLPPNGSYLVFEDEDQDNVWRGSMVLEEGTYFYKFVSLSSTEPQVSNSYPDVTGWYPDPLNPLTDGSAYNNSVLIVTDPMIYYLLPMDNSQVEDQRPVVSATFGAGLQTGLDVGSLSLKLDGMDVTQSAVFDEATNCLTYVPTVDLSLGWHTVEASCRNGAGGTATAVSRFQVIQGPPRMHVRFALDTQSPNFGLPVEVSRVQVTGDFSNWAASPTRFQDHDRDGVWEASLRMEVGRRFLYRFIVNGTLYVPDPDNPVLELRNPGDWYVSVGRANPLGPPRILDLSHLQGFVIPPGHPGPVARFAAVPGDWGTALVPESLTVALDGAPHAATPAVAGETLFVSLEIPPLDAGLHAARVRVVDTFGRVGSSTFSFGAFDQGNGFHAVDSFGDDKGPGRYRYPEGVTPGAADIWAFHVGTSTRLDPVTLQVIVDMAAVDAHTALGLWVTSSLDGPPTPLPGDIDVIAPPWQGQGAFLWLVPPFSPYFDETMDNRLIFGFDPLELGPPVGINPDPEITRSFIVSIPLADLEARLGTYSSTWFWGLVSTLRTDAGVELEPSEGGGLALEDPDVYDAAFFVAPSSQERILGGWIEGGQVGGPRLVGLLRPDRGIVELPPDSIEGLPQPGPEVLFFSAGSTLVWRSFRVRGVVSDPTVTSGLFMHNRNVWPIAITDGLFSVPLTLSDGPNYVGVRVGDASGHQSITWARYDCHPDRSPKARIRVTPSPDGLTLDGASSFHPDGGTIVSFLWGEEPGNPAPLGLEGLTGSQATVSLPRPQGEYGVRLTVSDGVRVGSCVATLRIDETGASLLDPEAHPRWAADNLVYEIYPVAYSSTRDLAAITADLDRIRGLGVKTLWLTPIFAGPEAHGYAITDHFSLNPAMGDSAALATLVSEAHARGMKVILDLVINHTSIQHPFMRDALRYGANSAFRDYYLWNPDGSYQSYWADLPNLNYDNPEVWAYVLRVSQFWVERFDIDGYRCDVAWGVQERAPTFWRVWRDSLKVVKDSVLLLGEASVEDPGIFAGAFDAAYDWGFMHHLKNVLRGTESPAQLQAHLEAFPGTGDGPLALRFLENHDETRFIAEFGPARTKTAAAVLYASPGLPLLYAGQEVGELTQRYTISWSDPSGLQPFYRTLGALRERLTCLQRGAYRVVPNSNPTNVLSFARDEGDQRVFVAANCRAFAQQATLGLPVEAWGLPPHERWVVSNLLTGAVSETTTEGLGAYTVILQPYEVIIAAVADSAVVGIEEEVPRVHACLLLDPPSPNPARGTTTVRFTLPAPGRPVLELWDMAGHRRATVDTGLCEAGAHALTWSLRDEPGLGPGAYLVVVRTGGERAMRPLVVLP